VGDDNSIPIVKRTASHEWKREETVAAGSTTGRTLNINSSGRRSLIVLLPYPLPAV